MNGAKSIRTQIMNMALALVMAAGLVGAVGVAGSLVIVSYYRVLPNTNIPNLNSVADMLTGIRAARMSAMAVAIDGASEDEIKVFADGVQKAKASFFEAAAAYESIPFANEKEEAIYNEFKSAALGQWKIVDRLLELGQKHPAPGTPDMAEMKELALRGSMKQAQVTNQASDALEAYHDAYIAENVFKAGLAAWIAILSAIALVLTAAGLGYAYSKKFTAKLSEGLLAISKSLNEAGQQVSAAATEISASSQTLSTSTTQQASSLAETAASIEEMNSMVAKNSENSRSAAEVSQRAETVANRGQQGVQNMIVSMAEIAASNDQVTEIVRVIREIGEKTKVINDIVFQTKLLSFNASVEAARAGEHGKGFAVVAEEVGNLAQMSGNAAKEISTLLEASVSKVESIVTETKKKVDAGTVTAQESGVILNEIVDGVSRVAVMAGEISSASAEQATGVGEITKAMNQLDQTTQQNAATSEEAASAAEELSAQAESLNALVGQLIHLVNGDEAGVAQTTSAAKPQTSTAKVLPLQKRLGLAPSAKKSAPVAKAAGSSFGEASPSFDDDRFKDI